MTTVKELPVEIVPIDSLNLWEGNPRINAAAIPAVRRSIEYFGFTNPILARREDRMVIAGHTRIASLREMGEDTAPVIFLDLSEADAKLLNITDNQTGQIAGWDDGKLSEAMMGLGDLGMDLALTGFDVGRIRELTRNGAGGDDFDVEAALEDSPGRVERGQVWRCGDHRVMCGDSTIAEDVARLMAGEKARVVVADPPYGIAYEHDDRPAERPHKFDQIAGDALEGNEFQSWLEGAIGAIAPSAAENAAWYLWHAQKTQGYFAAAAAAAAGIIYHRQIVWVKPHFTFGRGVYHWRHELCLMGWREGCKPPFYGERNQTTVWEVDYDGQRVAGTNTLHANQKPIGVIEPAITNHLRVGETVLDPFIGSGTTMIAAERLGRRCYGMEIEPRYVAVTLARWEAETGRKAVLEADRDGMK
jgi:site-specific DNA-methyltransferase (adenine-specific)